MEKELNQMKNNETWELNEDGQVTINKSRLVCKGYAQVEGLYFEDFFSSISRMEAIRLILAYECSTRIRVYQMDVK
jgi:hypothetical protein